MPRQLGYYEIACDIRSARPTEVGAYITANCVKGGGFKFSASFSLRRLASDRLQFQQSPMDGSGTGFIENYFRCQQRPSGETRWDHNGSLVSLRAEGNTRTFVYDEPRAGIAAVGVRPGTILFKGEVVDGRYFGTAHIFTPACGAFPYAVEGMALGGERVRLRGRAPRVDKSCRVIGYIDDILEFRLLR
jgi:hypothetical protein